MAITSGLPPLALDRCPPWRGPRESTPSPEPVRSCGWIGLRGIGPKRSVRRLMGVVRRQEAPPSWLRKRPAPAKGRNVKTETCDCFALRPGRQIRHRLPHRHRSCEAGGQVEQASPGNRAFPIGLTVVLNPKSPDPNLTERDNHRAERPSIAAPEQGSATDCQRPTRANWRRVRLSVSRRPGATQPRPQRPSPRVRLGGPDRHPVRLAGRGREAPATNESASPSPSGH